MFHYFQLMTKRNEPAKQAVYLNPPLSNWLHRSVFSPLKCSRLRLKYSVSQGPKLCRTVTTALKKKKFTYVTRLKSTILCREPQTPRKHYPPFPAVVFRDNFIDVSQ